MKWVAEHLQLIIAVAGVVAWWLNQRKGVKVDEEGDPVSPPEKTFEDPELAERTRRIREEIQRKIEHRAKGYAHEQPRPVEPEPVEPPPVHVELPPVMRELLGMPEPALAAPPRAATRQEAQRQAEILEQQAALAEKLEEARLMKAAAEKRRQFESAVADHTVEVRAETRSTVLDDLRTPAALRRAFILREVLGPPVGLR